MLVAIEIGDAINNIRIQGESGREGGRIVMEKGGSNPERLSVGHGRVPEIGSRVAVELWDGPAP